jgi:tetratricopeptide (TPR) repeat protein
MYDEGLTALNAVVATGDPDEAPRALRNIGVLKEDILGDVDGARSAFEAAIAWNHPLHSQGARVNLAQLLEKEGDRAGAALLFREVIDSDHPVESPRARTLLGFLLESEGEDDQALAWFESAMAVGADHEWAQRGAFAAGGIHLRRGEFDRAAAAFRTAELLPEPDNVVMAMYLRGDAERLGGDEMAALDVYEATVAAATHGTPTARQVRAAAAKQAGLIRFHRQDATGARQLLITASEADDPEERARGLVMLGICERQLGNSGAAAAALERAASIAGAPEEVRESARRLLSELR